MLYCRQIYFLVDFILFFFNVLLGFISCIRRILFSMIFGTILISRLDRPLLMRGYERFDAGQLPSSVTLKLCITAIRQPGHLGSFGLSTKEPYPIMRRWCWRRLCTPLLATEVCICYAYAHMPLEYAHQMFTDSD